MGRERDRRREGERDGGTLGPKEKVLGRKKIEPIEKNHNIFE